MTDEDILLRMSAQLVHCAVSSEYTVMYLRVSDNALKTVPDTVLSKFERIDIRSPIMYQIQT